VSIRIGIVGYGNLARGAEASIKDNADMELVSEIGKGTIITVTFS